MIEPIDLQFPRPVRQIHQIELSSRCSLRCSYCTSPAIVAGKYPGRTAMDMSLDTLNLALEHVKFFNRRGTQGELNLAGIGESMMRADFLECVERVRRAAPFNSLIMATNGLHMTEEIAAALAKLKVRVFVSLHRPERASLAVEIAERHGILDGLSADPVTNPDSWAGQVKWRHGYRAPVPCNWMREGWAFVFSDGRISSCCLDAQGLGVIGHVKNEPGTLTTKPYELCKSCQQDIAVKGYNQRTP